MNAVLRADGVGADDHALDQRVRAGHHQRDVLAGARLGLVGVDDEVLRLRVVLRDEAPLHAGREAGAAAAAQAGVLDRRRRSSSGSMPERLLQGAVAAAVLVRREGPGRVGVPVVGEDRGQGVDVVSDPSPSACSLARPSRPGRGSVGLRGGRLRAGPSASRGRARGRPARRARRRALVGEAVGEAGEHPLGLAPGARCRGPRVELTSLPARRSSTSWVGRLGRHVVHELPVDHHHRRVVAGRVALDVLEGDLAVLGGLVVADVEVVLEPLEDQRRRPSPRTACWCRRRRGSRRPGGACTSCRTSRRR